MHPKHPAKWVDPVKSYRLYLPGGHWKRVVAKCLASWVIEPDVNTHLKFGVKKKKTSIKQYNITQAHSNHIVYIALSY